MPGLLQVAFYRPDSTYTTDLDEIESTALAGSDFTLDRQQTVLNDGIAMITTDTEETAERLMDDGEITLPSGYRMEIPT